MSTVNSVNANNPAATALSNATNSSVANLGINDFITLMTTQLKYQDPTQPQDPTQMVSQLAQFSTVSGVQQLNSSMSSLTSQFLGSQAISASSLVGHSVMVQASSAAVTSGASISGAVTTPSGASSETLVITDASGKEVRQMSVPVGSGSSAFTWDGKDDNGNPVATGQYQFKAIANVGGTNTAATISLLSKVDSVTINNSDNSLQINTDALGSVSFSDVQKIF